MTTDTESFTTPPLPQYHLARPVSDTDLTAIVRQWPTWMRGVGYELRQRDEMREGEALLMVVTVPSAGETFRSHQESVRK